MGQPTSPALPDLEVYAMPIHDWTRVGANRFHHFHQSWTVALGNALNAGRLPAGYFAMVEQKAGGPEPDVITLIFVLEML